MTRLARLALAICLLGAPAAAKDVCIQHAGTKLVLSKAKLPKAGASVPLAGFFTGAFTPPFVGSLTRLHNGSILAAGTYYLQGATCFERLYVDETLAGSGVVECTNDLDDDIAITWARIDCATVVVP